MAASSQEVRFVAPLFLRSFLRTLSRESTLSDWPKESCPKNGGPSVSRFAGNLFPFGSCRFGRCGELFEFLGVIVPVPDVERDPLLPLPKNVRLNPSLPLGVPRAERLRIPRADIVADRFQRPEDGV